MELMFFGVRIDGISSREDLRRRFEAFLTSGSVHTVMTPNPEILLLARDDPGFAQTLNAGDLFLPDGIGVTLLSFFERKRRIHRFPGIDAAEILLALAERRGDAVLLLGGQRGAASRAKAQVRQRYPSLRLFVAGEDVCFGNNGTACAPETEERIQQEIRVREPAIILVGLGAPRQERWMVRHKDDFPFVRIMMGVGGVFDIWSGRLRRAPKLMRVFGFEWLWRLAQEPSRMRRIVNATIIFPWYAVRE